MILFLDGDFHHENDDGCRGVHQNGRDGCHNRDWDVRNDGDAVRCGVT